MGVGLNAINYEKFMGWMLIEGKWAYCTWGANLQFTQALVERTLWSTLDPGVEYHKWLYVDVQVSG